MKTLVAYVVEDNPTVLSNLIETLNEIAHVQVTAHSATQSEASQWLERQHGNWHLAIVDLFLRQGTGFGVLAACRDRQSHQKMVILTNYATPEIRLRSAALGADAVFDKSTELDGLLAYCLKQTHKFMPENRQETQRSVVSQQRQPN